MVTADGRVKVLDFGLAKAETESSSRGDTAVATLAATQEGRVVGTPSYMSPEQAEGKTVDTRSDIFSLGIVFYEMLSGERPFAGGTAAAIVSSILRDTPRPVNELQPALPRELARLVHRCLAKDPIDRYQSAIDLRHGLEEMKQDVDSGDALPSHPAANRSPRSMRMPLAIAAGVLVAIVAGVWLVGSRGDQRVHAVPRLQNAVQVTSSLDVESYPTWSPDGARLAYQASEAGHYYIGNHDIWVAQLGGGEPVNLTKDSPANDRMPSWSPDGREIAFFSDREGNWGVYTVAAIGGNPRNVLSLPAIDELTWSAPQWSTDGTKLFVSVNQAGENVVIVLSLQSLETTRVRLPEARGKCLPGPECGSGRSSIRVCGGIGRSNGGDSTLDDSGLGRRGGSAHGRAHQCLESHLVKGWTHRLLRVEPRRQHGPLATGGGGRRTVRRGAACRYSGARHSFRRVFSRWQHAWRTRGEGGSPTCGECPSSLTVRRPGPTQSR